jgi:hypothetical protein
MKNEKKRKFFLDDHTKLIQVTNECIYCSCIEGGGVTDIQGLVAGMYSNVVLFVVKCARSDLFS